MERWRNGQKTNKKSLTFTIKLPFEAPGSEVAEQKVNKKKKYALLIGYCGEGYFGLQRYSFNQLSKGYFDRIGGQS